MRVRSDLQEHATGRVDEELHGRAGLAWTEEPIHAPVVADREEAGLIGAVVLPRPVWRPCLARVVRRELDCETGRSGGRGARCGLRGRRGGGSTDCAENEVHDKEDADERSHCDANLPTRGLLDPPCLEPYLDFIDASL